MPDFRILPRIAGAGQRGQHLTRVLAQEGARRVYVDGGQVVQAFLRSGLIEDMVITTVPVLIGSGRPLFGALPADRDLSLVASRSFPSGLVLSTYRVLP